MGLTKKMGLSAMTLAGVSAMAVYAGEYTPIGKTGGQYRFIECEKPAAPVLALNPKKRGNAGVRDYNAQVMLYNAYIAEVQTYMDCLTEEADRDLETYYKAVNASLEEQQLRMQDESDALRKVLANGPNKSRKRIKPDNVPALEGAEPLPTPSVKLDPIEGPEATTAVQTGNLEEADVPATGEQDQN